MPQVFWLKLSERVEARLGAWRVALILRDMDISKNLSLLLKLLDLIREEIPSSPVVVLLAGEKNQAVFKELCRAAPSGNEAVNREVIRKAIEEKHPVIINNLDETPSFWRSEAKPRNILCLPLIIDSKPSAVLYLDRKQERGPFSQENLELLIAISKPINLLLKNSPGVQEVEAKADEASEPLLVGRSKAFRRILSLIDKVKDSDAPVLIWGESGTGKELVARAIHQSGVRNRGKFVAVNCGAIPELLLESELFGYTKGAFTGAVKDKPGLIEEAHRGTFFLDEIGDLSLHLQAKLLRLLEEKEIRRIGENRPRMVNARFISATNKNVEEEIGRGNFREDLYYRLKIIAIESPPLRERREDLLFLLNHFLEKYSKEMNRERPYFSPRALEMLMSYSWPGNVRELQNEIKRCLIFTGDNLIKEEYLSSKINPQKESSTESAYDFFLARAEFEKRFLNQALARWNYNRAKTAGEIGLSRQGLFKLIKKHKINVPKEREF